MEIRIGRENRPSWVDEAGIPAFFHPFQAPDPALGLRFRPQRFDGRVIRHGSQTGRSMSWVYLLFDNRVIRHGSQTGYHCDLRIHGLTTG